MCVEVDYTTLDCNVFHPKWHFVYGRPSIIIFRDRFSSALVGKSVFFGKPNFEAFLDGLKNTIYPKDLSAFPGLQSDIYGLPIMICVDAEFNRQRRHACRLRRNRDHPARASPRRPELQRGFERTIRTLNELAYPQSSRDDPLEP